MTPPPPTPTSQNGIDIRDALSILSDRSKKGGDNALTESSVPDELKEMGQTINVADQMEFTKPNAVGCDCVRDNDDGGVSASSVVNEEEDKKHEAMKQERARRGEEIREKLQSMGAVDLLGMIFRAQQERVATYKVFEE